MSDSKRQTESSEPLPMDAFLASEGQRKRSGVRFWLLVFGGTLGVCGLAGCLLISLFCRTERTTVPAEVLQASREIADVTPPAGYAGELSEFVETPLFTVHKAIFRHESGKGVLTLAAMRFVWSLSDGDDAAVEQTLAKLIPDMRQLIVAEESERTVSIGGAAVVFHLWSGTDTLSSTRLHEVRGSFSGKLGRTQLWLQAEDAVWEPAEIDAWLNTLASP